MGAPGHVHAHLRLPEFHADARTEERLASRPKLSGTHVLQHWVAAIGNESSEVRDGVRFKPKREIKNLKLQTGCQK